MSVLRTGAGVVVGLTPLLASGCNGVFWGNLGVLSITVAIFLGTVFLSRSKTGRGASRSVRSLADESRARSVRSLAEEPRARSVRSLAEEPQASTASTSHHS